MKPVIGDEIQFEITARHKFICLGLGGQFDWNTVVGKEIWYTIDQDRHSEMIGPFLATVQDYLRDGEVIKTPCVKNMQDVEIVIGRIPCVVFWRKEN